MRAAVAIPVTVKCRIGIDDQDHWEFLREFVAAIAEAGCARVIVHARKAILKGLTPKQNREVPPLDYARAWRVKEEFPALTVVVNGGLRTVPQVAEQLAHADGVMLGPRGVSQSRTCCRRCTARSTTTVSRRRRPERSPNACAGMRSARPRPGRRSGPSRGTCSGLFNGRAGARAWRHALSEGVNRASPTPALIERGAARRLAALHEPAETVDAPAVARPSSS